MKTIQALYLCSLIFIICSSGLHLCTDKWDYDYEDDYLVIDVPCQGGSGDYQYHYDDLPIDWHAEHNRIYAHFSSSQEDRYFGCRVEVYDRVSKITIKRSLIFTYTTGFIQQVYEAGYDFNYHSQETIQTYISTYQHHQYEITYQSYNSHNLQKKSTKWQHPAYVLPDWKYVQELIVQSNVQKLEIIIKEVIECSLKCEVRVQFLNRVLSRIQSHIAITRTQTERYRQTIFLLKEQMSELEEEIIQITKDKISTDEFKLELQRTQIKLKKVVSTIQERQHEIYEYREEMRKVNEHIFSLKTREVTQIQRDTYHYDIQIEGINFQIQNYQKKIKYLQNQKKQIIAKKEKMTIRVKQIKIKLKSLHEEIKIIRSKIQKIVLTIQSQREKQLALEYKVQRLRIDISRDGSRYQSIRQIEEIIFNKKQEIQKLSVKIETNQKLIVRLDSSVNSFSDLIDKHYYKCYDIYNDKDDFVDNGLVTVRSDAFLKYLEQSFGHIRNRQISSRFSGKVKLRRYNIFSPAWIKVYGIPYSSGYGNNLDYFKEQFDCKEVQNLQAFEGVIESINKNTFKVRISSGQTLQHYNVHLGGCTEIEAALEDKLPDVGDNIYFKGRRAYEKYDGPDYWGYKVTCL